MKGILRIVILCLLACLTACSAHKNLQSENATVICALAKPDGTKIVFGPQKISDGQTPESVFRSLQKVLSGASGSVEIQANFGPSLSLEIKTSLVDGKTEGTLEIFMLAEGKRFRTLTESYLHDQKHGHCIAYLPDGSVQYEGEWIHGAKDGLWTINYRNGKPAIFAHFQNNEMDGEAKVLDGTGTVVAIGDYKEGIPVNGSFIKDPSSFLTVTGTSQSRYETTLMHYKDGSQRDSSPLTITLGK